MLRMIVPAVIGLTCLVGTSPVEGGYLIDDFSQGTPFETVYTSGLIDSQSGLDAQHLLGGQRLVFFPTCLRRVAPRERRSTRPKAT